MLCKCEDLRRSVRSCLKPCVLMHRLQPQYRGMWTLLELVEDTIHPPQPLHTQLPGDIYTAHAYHTHKSKNCFSVVIIAHSDKNVEKLVSKYIIGGRVKWYSYSEKQIWQFISLSFSVPVFLSLSLSHTKTHTHAFIYLEVTFLTIYLSHKIKKLMYT